MAAPLPRSQRSAFLEAVAVELARYPTEARGPGSLSRIARDLQRAYLWAVAALGRDAS